jgi:AcrR family transcriptional regulator
MYAHFSSKAELLACVVQLSNTAVLERLRFVDDATASGRERLRTIVSTLTESLAVNHAAGRVANYEYRHLPTELRGTIDQQRVAIRDLVADAMLAGVGDGSLEVGDAVIASRAVLSMCIDVCRWFGDDENVDAHELGAAYAAIVLDLCHAR